MATPTNGAAAHDILLGYEPLSRHGACWYYNWQAYAAAGASTSQGSSPTAYDGWNRSEGKHPGDRNPPHGAAIWLGRRYDGNTDGDVFNAGRWDGDHAATDQPVYGQTATTSIQARMDLCGREYLGWTDHVLDCPIDLDTTDNEKEDDMTPEQIESLNECRRMLGVILGWNPAVNNGEAGAVNRVWGEGDSIGENRRMIGVILGWNAPASVSEWEALALLWGGEEAVAEKWGAPPEAERYGE